MGIFQFEDIHHTLKSKFIKVKTVTHVIVRGHRLRIIVDHHTAIPLLADGIQSLYPTPIKFYGRTDTVGTGTENNDRLTVAQIMYIIGNAAISQIQIVGLCRIFGGKGINLLHYRQDSCTLAQVADIKNPLLHISFITDGTGNLEIGETLYLGFAQQVQGDGGRCKRVQLFRGIHDVHQLLQKPLVYFSQFMHLTNGISGPESF